MVTALLDAYPVQTHTSPSKDKIPSTPNTNKTVDRTSVNIKPNKELANVDGCLVQTHNAYTGFNSTPNTSATTLWVTIHIKLNQELAAAGDYLMFSAGNLALRSIAASFTNATIPDGKIVADNTVSSPITSFDLGTNTWITKVPLSYKYGDIFIKAGAPISTNGFTVSSGKSTTLTGKFYSNITSFSGSWLYGLAAYQPTFTYVDVAAPGTVLSEKSGQNTGTPTNQTGNLVAGGSDSNNTGGGNNYTGNYSSTDNFSVYSGQPAICSPSATATSGPCNPVTNQYTLTGTISAINTNNAQSFTVSVGSSSTVVTLRGDGTVNYTLAGLTSDWLNYLGYK